MSIPLNMEVDEEIEGPIDLLEYPYILPAGPDLANQVDGDMGGVQAGWVFGGVTINNASTLIPALPELVARRVATEELEQVSNEFVETERFGEACRKLLAYHVVVLCGTGTGRTFTGRRLLVDRGVTDIVDLNPDRRLGNIMESDLVHGEGYLWDASDQGSHPFTAGEFHRSAAAVRSVGCRLVIVLDNRRQVPPELSIHTVELNPPDPAEVAVAVLAHRCPDGGEREKQVLKCDLAGTLEESDPPEKGVRAALLAMDVVAGRCDVAEAQDALSEDAEHAVSALLEGWSTIEYSMSLAVALLEDHPLDEVVTQAMKLDDAIRSAELSQGIPLPPRKMFSMPRHELLAGIRAVTVKREHPHYPGLTEETVRFVRQGWSDAVLRQVWREYHVSRTVVRDWMFAPALLDRFGSAGVRALCTLITGISAYELVDHLASRQSVTQRKLAVRVLNRLVDAHGLRPLVEQTLQRWVASTSVHRQWTSALVYGSGFGRQSPHQALRQLMRLGHSLNLRVQNGVVQGLLDLLLLPENQQDVLSTVVSWLRPSPFGQPDGLRTVALGVGMQVVGFSRDFPSRTVDPVLLTQQYPEQVRILAEAILDDQRFGPAALRCLARLAWHADLSRCRRQASSATDDSAELLRLVTLFAPDLRWWPRRRVVATLSERHTTGQTDIRHIFRTARRLQRAEQSW